MPASELARIVRPEAGMNHLTFSLMLLLAAALKAQATPPENAADSLALASAAAVTEAAPAVTATTESAPAATAVSPTAVTSTVHTSAPTQPLFGPDLKRRTAPPANDALGGGSLVRYLGSMALLVLLFGGAWWLLKRLQGSRQGRQAPGLRMMSKLAISPRQSVVLVRVHGEDVLIGVTAERLNLLARYALLDGEDLPEGEQAEDDPAEMVMPLASADREVSRETLASFEEFTRP